MALLLAHPLSPTSVGEVTATEPASPPALKREGAIRIRIPSTTTCPVAVDPVLHFAARDPTGATPRINMTGEPDASKETSQNFDVRKRVVNARHQRTTLDAEGFALVDHPTTVLDFDDFEELKAKYYAEMRELVMRHAPAGAEKAVLFDTTIRKVQRPGASATELKRDSVAPRGGHGTRAVNKVHGDYTAVGARRRVTQLGAANWSDDGEAEPLLARGEVDALVGGARRYMVFNVWRNISHAAPVRRMPMAFLDNTTVRPSDLFTVELHFPSRVGENLSIDDRATHRWCHFPAMARDEAVIFKTFDSAAYADGADAAWTGGVLHSAFDDPTTRLEDPTRESIEARVLVLFPEKLHAPARMLPAAGVPAEEEHDERAAPAS